MRSLWSMKHGDTMSFITHFRHEYVTFALYKELLLVLPTLLHDSILYCSDCSETNSDRSLDYVPSAE